MTDWAILAAIAGLAALIFALPLLLRPRRRPAEAPELAIHRDQLGELEADEKRGLIGAAEAKAARLEIERRILKAAASETPTPEAGGPRFWLAALTLIVIPAAAFAIYAPLGRPHLAGAPFASREREAPSVDVATLIARIETRLQETPDDPRGWMILGQIYLSQGRAEEAVDAFGRAAFLSPGNPSAAAALGQALIAESGGQVTPAARQAFERVLILQPGHPAAEYYLALERLQAGDAKTAYARFKRIAAAAPADAPYLPSLQAAMDEAAAKLGKRAESAAELARAKAN